MSRWARLRRPRRPDSATGLPHELPAAQSFPCTQRPDRERILTELTRYEVRAITGEA